MSNPKLHLSTAAVLVALLAIAWVATGPRANARLVQEVQEQEQDEADNGEEEAVDPRIQPGDLLIVRVAFIPDRFTPMLRPVSADGTVTLPYGLRARVGGLDGDAAAGAVMQAFRGSRLFERPQEAVTVGLWQRADEIDPDLRGPVQPMDWLEMQWVDHVGGARGPMALRIDPDGRVFVPFVGRVDAAGRALTQLEEVVAQSLAANNIIRRGQDAPLFRKVSAAEAEALLRAETERAATAL